jgi:excinuclease UvrABC nuclease subunit
LGSIQAIQAATIEELTALPGITLALANAIKGDRSEFGKS